MFFFAERMVDVRPTGRAQAVMCNRWRGVAGELAVGCLKSSVGRRASSHAGRMSKGYVHCKGGGRGG